MKAVPKFAESESGQIGKREIDLFDVYLSQTKWNPTKKINEKAQTANFSDLTRQCQELGAENAKNNNN